MNLDTVKQVISALLDKTTARGCTSEETAAAAAKAQELLTRHRLEMADLFTEGDDEEAPTEGVLDEAKGDYRFSAWRGILARAVAEANGCFALRKFRPSRVVIFGTRANRDIAVYLYAHLFHQVKLYSRLHLNGAGRTAGNSYRMGMVQTLCRRLREGAAEARSGATEHALVRVDRELELARQAAGPFRISKGGYSSNINRDYYALGREHGHQIGMHRGLTGGRAARRLLK